MIVYTAITNHYDTLKAPLVTDPGVRYVAFLDGADYTVPEQWEVCRIDTHERNPRVTSRRYKLLPHLYLPDTEVSIWIDASLQISHSLLSLAEGLRIFSAFPHPDRDCVYDEASAVIVAGVAAESLVNYQMSIYRAEGYPAQRGLFMAGLMIRRHNHPALISASEDWFYNVVQYSQRDQLSGMVALWREGLTYEPLPGKLQDYVKYIHHPHVQVYRNEGTNG